MRAKKRIKWKKYIISVLLLLVMTAVAYGGYFFFHAYNAATEAYEEIDRPDGNSELRNAAVHIGKEPISLLLIGIEEYATSGENGRADSLIVVTLNPKTENVTITSIPRDTRVEFTEEEAGKYAGTHKINAAYSYGSMNDYGANKLTVEKVEQLLNIPIDEYVTVNFDGFRDLVNALGGVTVNIKEPFWEKDIYAGGERIYFEKGEKKLNGEEALAFVRMRKREINNIYSRDERQRQFIEATIDEAISTNTLFKVGEISKILGKNVTTSLSPTEIFQLQHVYSSINTAKIKSFELEGEGQIIDRIYYFVPSEEGLDNISNTLKQELELAMQEGAEDIEIKNN
ncbi:LCP family protein [Robertmurraya sp. DFI.2.37]|uniref:LCP family protein n=1 Tax=Robertmurraya sp. DFI.2.37 TaxID=3031819 RepID=UPI0023DB2A43|nr:LCP family protein [Robertmurraya sp. DFI.2.37]MDF1510056.1 LCP family protein [Robertmurraya sp. DFI.2.37]